VKALGGSNPPFSANKSDPIKGSFLLAGFYAVGFDRDLGPYRPGSLSETGLWGPFSAAKTLDSSGVFAFIGDKLLRVRLAK
jgi:hypothetical protein